MNPALTSQFSYEDHELAFRKANYKILQLTLVAAGYDAERLTILSPACQTNLLVLEKRKAEWVQVYLNALAAKIDLTTFADITVCDTIFSTDTELSGTRASLTTALTGTHNDIVWTARSYGSISNILQVKYANEGSSQTLSVTVIASLIKIALATSAGGVITSTATQVRAAVAAFSAANSLVSSALVESDDGTGLVTILAATNLRGGTD